MAGLIRVCRFVLAVLLFPGLAALSATSVSTTSAQTTGALYAYHQITNLTEGSGNLGFPVLSADGSTAVFSDAPGTQDPATPNRIYTIASDGSGLAEVDSYVPLCFCGAIVDINSDGTAVVSSDSMQIRLAGSAGVVPLITLTSNEISTVAITGDGLTVYFLVRRDAAIAESGEPVTRGIWAIDASGANLRQLVSADAVAAAAGVPIEQTGCCFHGDGGPLDISTDGGQLAFGAFAGTGEHVFTADGSGGSLTIIRENVNYVFRVAISGDGSTAAYDVLPFESSTNELGVVSTGGGEAVVMPGAPNGGFDEPIQLSDDGSTLLVSPNGLLFDSASGDVNQLAISIPNLGGSQEAVLTDGLARSTMDASAQKFLYVMRTVRCADCANLQEQLATMDIDPVTLGQSPVIADATIDPASIPLDGSASTTVQATIESADPVLGVGFSALVGGLFDTNVGSGAVLLDDGSNGDTAAGDGIFATQSISYVPVVIRENDGGPRTVRIAAEVETADGMRHATAADIGTLTVEG
ncbi:MAG: hypothetical protein R2839_08420 [Thermomicrobiales bacterium]